MRLADRPGPGLGRVSPVTPYYVGNGVTLYLGDALELLPELPRSGFLLTDPPYGIRANVNSLAAGRTVGRYKAGSVNVRTGKNKVGDLAYNPSPRKNLVYQPIVGDDRPFDPAPWLVFRKIVLFGANNYAARLPASNGWIVWDKIDGLRSVRTTRDGDGFADSGDAELAWTNVTGAVRLVRHRWMGMLKGSERLEARIHPTQKPVELMARILRRFADPADLVLDPFAGSGSTLVAAVREGHQAIGCEIVEAYAEAAAKRLERESVPMGLVR